MTVNLAAALAARGHEVGILDADIYGHSIPHMLGIDQKPVVVDKMIIPPVAHDLKLMSIGFFLDDNQPVMWRGPMLHRALEQFLQDVHWGELDVLVVDMPPGHGRRLDLARPAAAARGGGRRHDAAAARAGGRVARRDDGAEDRAARRGRRREHDVGGVRLGRRREARARARRAAARPDPLDVALRESGDAGMPLVVSDPANDAARAIVEIARADRREPRRRVHAHAAARLLSVQAAAFFDLDRTLIRRSSVLALAPSFRARGLISRIDLAKSAFWQLLFAARGASAERVRSAAEDGMKILAGFSVEEMQALVGDAMEPVLRPLVYAEPLHLVQHHRERGERVYIVSATLQEIVEHIADDLGFDGAIGSTCEIVDGRYTGRSLRAAHGEGKARALRELAGVDGLDLEPRPRTRTRTATCRSSRRSATPSQSTPTGG